MDCYNKRMSLVVPFLPQAWLLGLLFIYGLIIGSFLNVVIYRFHTGKSLAGSSHCLSCAALLRPYELLPLISYLALRGRCRSCGSKIPSRYFLVELLTGVLFVLAGLQAITLVELVYLLLILSLLVIIIVYDIRHYIIPDILTIALTILSASWLVWQWYQGVVLSVLGTSIIGAVLGSGFFFALWFISKGKWLGFGDVKLAFPLGLIVGGPLVFSMIVYSFWVGAAISILIVGLGKLQRGQLRLHLGLTNLTIKSVVPFAPFLIAGCLITLFTHIDVLTLFTFAQ